MRKEYDFTNAKPNPYVNKKAGGNGKFSLQNSNSIALKKIQDIMKGEAKKAGFKSPDDVTKYIKQLRKSKI